MTEGGVPMLHDVSDCFLRIIMSPTPPHLDTRSVATCIAIRRELEGDPTPRRAWVMSEHIQKTLADVQRDIADMERDVVKKKELANHLAEMVKLPPPYPVVN